jgi:hypothetical protein
MGKLSSNEQKINPIESISIFSFHSSLNLPQASRLLGTILLQGHGLKSAETNGCQHCTINMDARPGGPAAKRKPSPEGLGINSQDDLSAGGAALNLPVLTQRH